MQPLPLNKICRQVIDLSEETGRFILREMNRFSPADIEKKGVNDLVTYIDKTSEQRLIKGLQKILPGSGILAEESGATAKKEYTWVIDPLDGTTNFLHKLPCFAISIGLHKNEYPVLGVVNELNRKECFSAIKNEGATLNGNTIKVSQQPLLQDSLIATGFPYNDFRQEEAYINLFRELMKCTQGIRRIGSASVDMYYVACARFEVFYEYGLKHWDVSAGTLIVKEAGGKVSDFGGGNNPIFGRTIIASNAKLHKPFSAILQKYFPNGKQ